MTSAYCPEPPPKEPSEAITTKGKGETPAEGSVGRQQSVSKAQWAEARTELPVAEPAEVAAETIKQHLGKKNPATTIADTIHPA